jgi:hypothetical protein
MSIDKTKDCPDANGQELPLLLKFIKKTDPYQFSIISRKMVNYLYTKGISQAKNLFLRLGASGNEDSILTEINTPSKKQTLDKSFNLGDEIFGVAEQYIDSEMIVGLIQRWLQEEKLSYLLKTLANQNTRVADIADAIHRYYYSSAGWNITNSATGRGILVSLIRRFLTDQLEYIEIAKNHFEFNDFYELLGKTIYHPESHGKLGGKSAGAILAQKVIMKNIENQELFKDIKMPKTWFVSSDGTVNFLYYNNLEDVIEQKYKDIEDVRKEYHHIVQMFKNSRFSPEIMNGLARALDDFGDHPIIVRSSSLLEDRLGTAFPGKYKSLFLCNQGTKAQKLEALTDAIAEVYASTFSPDPIGYRIEKGLLDYNEEMGIMIQEVVGKKVGKYFFPAFAGVAFSYNEFRWSPRIKREDGLIRITPGLGTRTVDRSGDDYPVLISPTNPELKANTSFRDSIMYSPKFIDALNLETNQFETIAIDSLIKEVGSDYPMINQIFSIVRDGSIEKPVGLGIDTRKDDVVADFGNLISSGKYIKKISEILRILKNEYGFPVDIEFACDGDNLYILQCRPQSSSDGYSVAPAIPKNIPKEKIIFDANKFVSNGVAPDLDYIVYVDPIKYARLNTIDEMKLVGSAVGKLNRILPKKNFILMGPGRWGSRGDIKLGVPVGYSDINNCAVLIEIAKIQGDFKPDLSFGTHFFQDLVESDIKYLPLYPDDTKNIFNYEFLNNSENILKRVLPEYESLSEAIKVINVSEASSGLALRILMNADEEKAIAYLADPFIAESETERLEPVEEATKEAPWSIRSRIADMIAHDFDLKRFSAQSLILIGSTATKTSAVDSSIELLVIADDSIEENRIELLKTWFEGWNLSLRVRMFKRTGYMINNFIEITILKENELEKSIYFKEILASSANRCKILKKRQDN